MLVDSLVRHTRRASKWILPLLGLLAAVPYIRLPGYVLAPVERGLGLALIAAVAWLVILFSEDVSDVVSSRYQVGVADNLTARRIQTQIEVLHRVVVAIVIIVALALMLMTFPQR